MIEPLRDKVLVQRETEPQENSSGIILTTANEVILYGSVKATGPDVKAVTVGDRVLIPAGGSVKLDYEDEKFEMFPESHILGIVK